jgi:hypothetical protein
LSIYKVKDIVEIQLIEGQISIYEHECNLQVRNTVGTILRTIPLLELDEETLNGFPYLRRAEAYEVEVDGEIFGALGFPAQDGENYDVSDGLMFIAVLTGQIPSLIQRRIEETK